jgi:hypothetical protein
LTKCAFAAIDFRDISLPSDIHGDIASRTQVSCMPILPIPGKRGEQLDFIVVGGQQNFWDRRRGAEVFGDRTFKLVSYTTFG